VLKRDWEIMNEGSEKMGLYEKLLCGSLNPERTTDAAGLAGKSLLPLKRAEMLDNTVREGDVETSISVVELASVPDFGSDGRQIWRLDKIDGMKVECGDGGLVREIRPIAGIASDVENGAAVGRLHNPCESSHTLRPKTSAGKKVESMNVHVALDVIPSECAQRSRSFWMIPKIIGTERFDMGRRRKITQALTIRPR
jgi:hypothetical protein